MRGKMGADPGLICPSPPIRSDEKLAVFEFDTNTARLSFRMLPFIILGEICIILVEFIFIIFSKRRSSSNLADRHPA